MRRNAFADMRRDHKFLTGCGIGFQHNVALVVERGKYCSVLSLWLLFWLRANATTIGGNGSLMSVPVPYTRQPLKEHSS